MRARSVLAVNAGSSSIKFGLFVLERRPSALCRGAIDGAVSPTMMEQLLERVASRLETNPLAAVGHRIVHGGPDLFDPQLVTDDLLSTLRGLVRFAPNHLPDELQLIDAMRRMRPDVPQLVCFDTSFHAHLPPIARRLAIAETYDVQGVRRYGFHGLSYTFLIGELRRRAGVVADGRVVLMHLGNGSSVAAVRGGRSIDTSMGFTPIGGIVMGSRSGDLDPGVVAYIARTSGFDADRLEEELSHRSGLGAISGGVRDMRELLAREATDERSRLAVSIYCYEITKRIGGYAAALGGLDALVFSGGIGEHAAAVRARVCSGLEFLGMEIDDDLNAATGPVISTSASRVVVHVIPTDEEVVIAEAANDLLQ